MHALLFSNEIPGCGFRWRPLRDDSLRSSAFFCSFFPAREKREAGRQAPMGGRKIKHDLSEKKKGGWWWWWTEKNGQQAQCRLQPERPEPPSSFRPRTPRVIHTYTFLTWLRRLRPVRVRQT